MLSAPSLPDILSRGPIATPGGLLASLTSGLTLGTEVQLQMGSNLQTAVSRKLGSSSDADSSRTSWTAVYVLNSKMRV